MVGPKSSSSIQIRYSTGRVKETLSGPAQNQRKVNAVKYAENINHF